MKVFSLFTSLALLGGAVVSARTGIIQTRDSIDNSSALPEDLNGSNFTYPWPVKLYKFTSQLQELEMAFMDVAPEVTPNGKTVALFHGKNFCGPTWESTIRVLTSLGYRVIATDQIGFCKSTKPERYQFSLQQFATNTNGLLNTLGIESATIMGHSVGGMLATRYGLMFPDQVDNLILVDPVGLEDYTALGVPYLPIDTNYVTEAASTYASIQGYENTTYYVGQWKEEYDVWVNMLVNIYHGSKAETYALNQAQIVDMVLTQPVSFEFGLLQPRTLLIVGDKDRTAIGAQWSPPEVAAKLGHFDVLGPQVAAQIPNGTLVSFPALGHAPQISSPDEFHAAVLDWLST
ncbi:Alpha/Beta hydrolase protein [Pseudomassariella vexata]|uniref:Alpha/Beta hydrolase protein n=1 Tax=Pseudomassariella vexata TaxID=1141098 RepID=A0A1Y2D9G0_9PEZI|nr:Alpha/Beta hydrolase protein [Pseudomassariella vexata]ORY55909.1 Alpha/Beta hydrolase protein [Pseudomassariella vexata]